MSPSSKIAIVGAGLSGTLAALQLLRSGIAAELVLFEKAPNRLQKGVAYSGTLPYQPLNVVVGRMSLFSDDPTHFWRWLQENRGRYGEELDEVDMEAFVSRRVYGDYVRESFQLEAGDKVRTVVAEVRDIQPIEGGCRVEYGEGQSLTVDRVVLAWGNLQPKLPWPLSETPGIAADPWSSEKERNLHPDDEILLVGTGLTMVDWVVSLAKRGHRGRITALSRHGKLPRPHAHHEHWQPRSEWPLSLPQLLRAFREEAQRAEADGVGWISMMDNVRNQTAPIWQQLPLEERQRFLRHLMTYWDVHRHRMPGKSWAHLEALRESGQFSVLAGRIRACRAVTDGFEVVFKPRKEAEEKSLRVQQIINCTGPESDVSKIEDPLISNLYRRGLIQRDPLGLGLVADEKGHPVRQDGTAWTAVVTLGSLRRAQLWETTALREIRDQAEQLGREAAHWVG
jgi:uncharacterized NAD(P)/FAD-binding protein YdhS